VLDPLLLSVRRELVFKDVKVGYEGANCLVLSLNSLRVRYGYF
jgi:hypothetical protein